MESREYQRHYAEAERALIYYFQTVWEEAGLKWDWVDNNGEVSAIIDCIRKAVAQQIAEAIQKNEKGC